MKTESKACAEQSKVWKGIKRSTWLQKPKRIREADNDEETGRDWKWPRPTVDFDMIRIGFRSKHHNHMLLNSRWNEVILQRSPPGSDV
jgi:hypothetical protein